MGKQKYKVNDEQLKKYIAESKSIREVLIKMNIAPYGGNYDIINKRIKEQNIDISHFTSNHGFTHNDPKKITLEDVKRVIPECKSKAEIRRKLGVGDSSGIIEKINKLITDNNLDLSHFTGMLWSKGKTLGAKYPIDDYLSNQRFISTHALRLRLIKEKILEHKCYECENTEWNNMIIPLELHHRDGNNKNNNLSNLVLLCPNCHAQTNNYRAQNKKSYRL